jgi:hypothetical protein
LAAHLQAQRIKNGSVSFFILPPLKKKNVGFSLFHGAQLHLDFPKLDFELDKLGHPVSVQRHETVSGIGISGGRIIMNVPPFSVLLVAWSASL